MPIHLPAPAHRNGGPDGQGWNRISLGTLAGDECALRPRDYSHLVESQDTRRARYGGYGPCIATGVWAWRAVRRRSTGPLAASQPLADQSPPAPGERRTAPRWARPESEQQQEAA